MLRKEGVKHAERVYMSVRWQDDAADTKLENERVRRSWERSLDAYKLDPARAAHAQGAIDIQDLPAGFALSTWPAAVPPAKTNASPLLAGAERDTIVAALRKHHWQVLASAKALAGMARATLYRKMARYPIVSPNKLGS